MVTIGALRIIPRALTLSQQIAEGEAKAIYTPSGFIVSQPDKLVIPVQFFRSCDPTCEYTHPFVNKVYSPLYHRAYSI